MSFDIADIDVVADSERGAFLHLRDPRTGAAIDVAEGPVGFDVLGPFAEVVQAKAAEITKRREAREAQREDKKSTDAELRADDIEMWCAAITGWRNMAWMGSEEFTTARLASMLEKRNWIGPQVQRFMRNIENFMQGRDKS